jgi:hypothetical protein
MMKSEDCEETDDFDEDWDDAPVKSKEKKEEKEEKSHDKDMRKKSVPGKPLAAPSMNISLASPKSSSVPMAPPSRSAMAPLHSSRSPSSARGPAAPPPAMSSSSSLAFAPPPPPSEGYARRSSFEAEMAKDCDYKEEERMEAPEEEEIEEPEPDTEIAVRSNFNPLGIQSMNFH